LSPELRACTKPEFFPGKNVLGKIFSEARQSLVQKHAEINLKTSTINPFLLPNEINEVEISENPKFMVELHTKYYPEIEEVQVFQTESQIYNKATT
jgi:CRISPR/Cas system-associated exonuclease Cas4 (RecB family)